MRDIAINRRCTQEFRQTGLAGGVNVELDLSQMSPSVAQRRNPRDPTANARSTRRGYSELWRSDERSLVLAKSEDKEKLAVVEPEAESKAPKDTGASAGQQPAAQATGTPPTAVAAQQQVTLDDAGASTCYANFCRVTGTPEEVILDLGLNPQPFGVPQNPVKVSQRLILNYFTAKRLLAALTMTVQRHEQAFGVLETDVQKRVRPGLRGGSGS